MGVLEDTSQSIRSDTLGLILPRALNVLAEDLEQTVPRRDRMMNAEMDATQDLKHPILMGLI